MALEILPLTTIGVIVVFALVMSTILKRLGLNPILGFIISGFLLGPFVLGFLHPADEIVRAFGEMGLFVLLFYLGLELSFKEFIKSGPTVVGLALIDMVFLVLVGVLASLILGFSPLFAIVIGIMLFSTSSAIVGKFILDKALVKNNGARLSLSILILQDFLGIMLLVFITSLSTSGSALDLALTSLVFAVAAFYVVRSLSYKVEDWMHANGMGAVEITLYALGIGLVVATLADVLSLSTAIGAYFAGFALSETKSGARIKHQVGFLREFFFLFFFVGFGTQLFYNPELGQVVLPSLSTLAFVIGFALALTLAIVLVNLFVFRFFGPLFGLKNEESAISGLLLTPLGEFVVIIATTVVFVLSPKEGALLPAIAFALILISLVLFQPLYNIRKRYIELADKIPTFKGIHMPRSKLLENSPHILLHVRAMALNSFIVLCLAAISFYLENALPVFGIPVPHARDISTVIVFLIFAALPLYNVYKHARYFYKEVWSQNRRYWKAAPKPKKWSTKKARA